MRGSRVRRPSHATVVAYIALFVALGGTAIATHPGGENTISTGDIINGQVKTDDLGNGEVKVADVGQGAVATDELVNGQVKAADIGDGEIKGADIANGQVTADDLAMNSVRADEVADGQVRSLEIGNGQVQAEDLAPGVAPGASGARAWGAVDIDGTLFRSKNVAEVTHEPNSGIYCIDPGSGIDSNTSVMVVGEDFNNSFTDVAIEWVTHVEWDSTPLDCGAGKMEVQTFFADGSQASFSEIDEGGFDLFRADRGFTFVIP
jgi:hypothetical protein